ncbi:hypothetical protein GTP55_22645, partial [Duganella sp. FT109W]|nr:hypothetical protein [Duganella margarita]
MGTRVRGYDGYSLKLFPLVGARRRRCRFLRCGRARELIKQTNPDVLTLDVEMPKMDGLD